MNTAIKRLFRQRASWAILIVYLVLFGTTDYVAFLARDHSPILDQGADRMVTQLSDERTKSIVMNALQEENSDYDKRTALANHAFNIILGSLLGFLSATAISKMSKG